ncbi:TOMM precursor leader peptide-binding protein [Rhodococcus hoagii]|nr:TOMM precursor leader peptide-binding protein [Prescottella equi]
MTSVAAPHLRRLVLDPRLPILVRPSGRIQIGWDPETAMILTPPASVDPQALISVLGLLDGRTSRPGVVWRAVEHGITPADISTILSELEEAGVLRPAPTPPDPAPIIRVHGRGPLADAISTALAVGPARVSRSTHFTADTDVTTWNCLCVVLTDDLVVDPRLVDALLVAGIPHLHVRLRDGRGVVGPLVLPGSTSCLRCADLTRSDADEEWPHVAAQLLGRVGHAGPATVLATAAVALGQLELVLSRVASPAPASLDATLEIDLGTHRFAVREWPRDPRCGCSRSTIFLDEPANLPP